MRPDRWKTPPLHHQLDGPRLVLERKTAGIFDEPGLGKSKQAIDAACELFDAGEIDTVVLVAPAKVRYAWDGEEFGQLIQHCWVPYETVRWDAKQKARRSLPDPEFYLQWVITSYPFLRMRENVRELVRLLHHRRPMLILDEAHALKNRNAKQSKGVRELREIAEYVAVMTATPYGDVVTDLWNILRTINPAIYPLSSGAFEDEFAKVQLVTVGKAEDAITIKKVVGVKNADRLSSIINPWVLRRKKEDCLDLPPKSYTVLEAPMSQEGWSVYREMKADLLASLGDATATTANTGVMVMRLQQITSGHLGGIRPANCTICGGEYEKHPLNGCASFYAPTETRRISEGKVPALLEWVEEQGLDSVIVFCRWVPEIELLCQKLRDAGEKFGTIYGGSTRDEEDADDFQAGRIRWLVCQQQAGGAGLNLTRASTLVYLSNEHSLVTRVQSEDRIYRIGQTKPTLIADFLATSPGGSRTVDHRVLANLMSKVDMANFTMKDWRKFLEEC